MRTPTAKSLACSDIEVASMLLTNGYKLLRTELTTPTRYTFYFEKNERIDNEVNNFYSGEMRINPLAFSNARKNLKSIIYSQKILNR